MQYCFPDSKSAETEGKNTLQQQFPLTTGRTKFDKILADQIRKLWNQNNTTKSKVLDVAYRHFTDEGSVSASELIRAMRAGAPDPHRLALVDLRDLPRGMVLLKEDCVPYVPPIPSQRLLGSSR